MTPFLTVFAVALGFWAALFIVGYAMIKLDDPYQRVAFLWSILATDVAALTFATFLMPPAVATVLFTFLLTKCGLWCIMSHKNIVHFKLTEE